jgi:hypothetical protein
MMSRSPTSAGMAKPIAPRAVTNSSRLMWNQARLATNYRRPEFQWTIEAGTGKQLQPLRRLGPLRQRSPPQVRSVIHRRPSFLRQIRTFPSTISPSAPNSSTPVRSRAPRTNAVPPSTKTQKVRGLFSLPLHSCNPSLSCRQHPRRAIRQGRNARNSCSEPRRSLQISQSFIANWPRFPARPRPQWKYKWHPRSTRTNSKLPRQLTGGRPFVPSVSSTPSS